MELEGIDFATAPWTEIDAALIGHDAKQSARDYWLGKCLLQIDAREIYRAAQFRSLANYMDVRLGWDPHTTSERRRTAMALENLLLLSQELREGRIRWSAVRELTRIATPESEEKWLRAAKGKTVHEIALACRTRHPGQNPEDRPDPNLFKQALRFECDGEEYALITSIVHQVRESYGPGGHELSDARCLKIALEGSVASYQVQATFCPGCLQCGMKSRSDDIPITATTMETLMCQAQIIGPDGKVRSRHLPVDVERAVRIRAGGKCEVPGCTSRLFIKVHHLLLFSAGGTHAITNLLCVCSVHHALIHAGSLWLEGSRHDEIRFSFADGTPIGHVPNQSLADAFQTAFLALRDGGVQEQRVHDALLEVRKQGHARTAEEILERAGPVLARMVSEARKAEKKHKKNKPADAEVAAEIGWESHVGLFTTDPGVAYGLSAIH
jgi:hypothetical protein